MRIVRQGLREQQKSYSATTVLFCSMQFSRKRCSRYWSPAQSDATLHLVYEELLYSRVKNQRSSDSRRLLLTWMPIVGLGAQATHGLHSFWPLQKDGLRGSWKEMR
jgi:hypothetical protein